MTDWLAAGEAVTFFAEDDVGHLKSVGNVMKASGCEVPEWMLNLKKSEQRVKVRCAAGPVAGWGVRK